MPALAHLFAMPLPPDRLPGGRRSGLGAYCHNGKDPAAMPQPTAATRANWASSVEPVSAVTDELPPWITVVTASK